jgi:hypothetical protein
MINSANQTQTVHKNCAMYSNNNAVHRVKRGTKMLPAPRKAPDLSAFVKQHRVFGVSAIVNAAQTN